RPGWRLLGATHFHQNTGNRNRDAERYAHAYAHSNPLVNPNCDTDAHADEYVAADCHTDAYGDTYANSNPHSNEHAYADAYPHANAHRNKHWVLRGDSGHLYPDADAHGDAATAHCSRCLCSSWSRLHCGRVCRTPIGPPGLRRKIRFARLATAQS